ncbi:MAG: hypothetical protein QM813_23990 [Verrucomicrobiota bacterium]
MRTKGFIFIALGVTAAALAGSPGYLPSVGPIGLEFAPRPKPAAAIPLPVLPVTPDSVADNPAPAVQPVADIPVPDSAAEPTTNAPVQNPPEVVLVVPSGSVTNTAEPLIGPMVETHQAVTPQMFLRFFSPNRQGASQEAIIAVPPGFNPALPPTSSPASSTVNYSQPKP